MNTILEFQTNLITCLGNANEVIRYIADPRLQTDPNFANNKFDNNTALHVAAENGLENIQSYT